MCLRAVLFDTVVLEGKPYRSKMVRHSSCTHGGMWKLASHRGLSALLLSVFVTACGGLRQVSSSPTAPSVPVAASATAVMTIPLTAGNVQLYSGDPGSADLVADGFEVKGMAGGSWPISVPPGGPVDFSTGIVLSNWGLALVNGVQLHGDPAGPGAGRMWIRGNLQMSTVPFLAPQPSGFTNGFQTTVTLTGSVSGFFNDSPGQPPLFTANVSGKGTASGVYRLVMSGSDPVYMDNCCAQVAISAQ